MTMSIPIRSLALLAAVALCACTTHYGWTYPSGEGPANDDPYYSGTAGPDAPSAAVIRGDVRSKGAVAMIITRNGDKADPDGLIRWWSPTRNSDARAMGALRSVINPMLQNGVRRVCLLLPGGSPGSRGTGSKWDGRMTPSHAMSMSLERRRLLKAYVEQTKAQYPGLEWWMYVGWGTDSNPRTGRFESAFGPNSLCWFPDIRSPRDVDNIVSMYDAVEQLGFDCIMIDAIMNQDRDPPKAFGSSDQWIELIEERTGLDVIAEAYPLELVPRSERGGRGDQKWRIDLERTHNGQYYGLMRFIERYGLIAGGDTEQFVGINNQWKPWAAAKSDAERVRLVQEQVLARGFTPVIYVSKAKYAGLLGGIVDAERSAR